MKTGIRAAVAAGLASGALSVAGAGQSEIVLDEAETRQAVSATEATPQKQEKPEQAVLAKKIHERIRERREADAKFWKSLKDKTPAQALAEVKVHVAQRHAERKQEMTERHQERVARMEDKEGDADKKAKILQRTQERHEKAVAHADKRHAEVTEKLNALDDKEDLTHADIRKAVRPPRPERKAGDRPDRVRRGRDEMKERAATAKPPKD